MVSLVILGAYDDMKQLVRDGSKKLREAEGLPDDTLLAINRVRAGASNALTSPNRQRLPPIQRAQDKSRSLPQSFPPKLKSNPKDRPKARRGDEKTRRSFVTDSCHDMLHDSQQGNNGDGDWRDALGLSRGFHSIWNCGGVAGEEGGTASPTQVCSPKDGNKVHAMDVTPPTQQQPVFEGRESALGHKREGELSARN